MFPVAYIVNLYVNTGERRFDGTRACVVKPCTLDNPAFPKKKGGDSIFCRLRT